MSRERNDRIAPVGEDVESVSRDGAALDFARKTGSQRSERLEEELANRRLVVGHRVDVYELARELENVGHALYLGSMGHGRAQEKFPRAPAISRSQRLVD